MILYLSISIYGMKPQFFTNSKDIPKNVKILDLFESALDELYIIDNPEHKDADDLILKQKVFKTNIDIQPIWVYYSWRNIVVKIVPEDIYIRLRTARNKNLITEEEQEKFRSLKVGIIGLSIGSSVLHALTRIGGPRYLKIADFDTIEITNLNRMRANLLNVGEKKVLVSARSIWEIDPFLEIDLWSNKIDNQSIKKFLGTSQKLNVVIDAMDSLDMKIMLRVLARKMGIPVLMATSNGDCVILDIERYDIDSNLPIFNGLLGDDEEQILNQFTDFNIKQDYHHWLDLALRIVDRSIMTKPLLQSIDKIGIDLAGVPQLSTTIDLGAILLCYIVRNISINNNVPSGRYFVDISDFL